MAGDQQEQPEKGTRLDRIEHALEGMLANQASHDARIESLLAVQDKHQQRYEFAELRLDRIDRTLDRITATQDRHEQELDGLMEIIQRSAKETDDLVRKRPQ